MTSTASSTDTLPRIIRVRFECGWVLRTVFLWRKSKESLNFFPFRFDVNWSLWSLMLFHCYYRSLHSFWIFEIKSSFIDKSQSNISLCCAWTVDYRNLFNLWLKINFDLLQGLNGDEGIIIGITTCNNSNNDRQLIETERWLQRVYQS